MQHVAILVSEPVPMFELGCALEVFSLPKKDRPYWYKCDLVSFDGSRLTSSTGVTLEVPEISELLHYDILIIPGWSTQNNKLKLSLAEQIVAFHSLNKPIISFCSGAFLIAQLGLLNHCKATTHWRYAELFQQRFPLVEYVDNVLYTHQDNVWCSAGSAAALDLSIEIVRQDFGHEIANDIARRLVISPHRSGGQAQFVETPVPAKHQRFSKTLDWAINKLNSPLLVDDLAKHASMSRRSFDRHFKSSVGMSPKEWLNQQRVRLARQILESDHLAMEELAARVGFDNTVTLRFNFHKFVGISPSEYQQQFFKG
ncbi:helix-turn-helix domain-containing protein [Aliiglaciecola sp. LCG003]|uniref:GlxA family transcriptional regulator n=1 Tax=Aliiglaciecola sp. LCG003 TaxID=3053655 RepID=UPI0025727E79|nr:helix-turn-helix domain-containing protein [Aliiglaciecola sp. LCG003]WJG07916.1 helix-turn-helix domain-containing protein [Aliiglaciecola sp. LCG003]